MDHAIEDIRALLWQFQKAGLKDFYLRSPEWRLFLARPDGGANPMLSDRIEAPAGPAVALNAPHLGLFEPCCAVGDVIAAGAVVARIDVLGRKTDVVAEQAGRVVTLHFAANDLVEYGQDLLDLTAA
jgi:acetyl-CoA carboxylase biotin carboxyl carrier protein